MMAATMKTYWIMIQAVRAVMPTVTGGLEVMVDTKSVVRARKSVTKRPMRPGTTYMIQSNKVKSNTKTLYLWVD